MKILGKQGAIDWLNNIIRVQKLRLVKNFAKLSDKAIKLTETKSRYVCRELIKDGIHNRLNWIYGRIQFSHYIKTINCTVVEL